ncbi:MAG TPA: hypothetical protein VE111_03195 [Bradyrhizobium sp.]|nr:hypothetical protein [Bradyrhizobium sp.]
MPDYALIKCRSSRNYANVFGSENGPPLGRLLGALVTRKVVSVLLMKKANRKKDVTVPVSRTGRVQLVTSRHVGSKGTVRNVEGQSSGSEHKLHIVMDKESLMRLRGLKGKLEASTESEVIRRALKAYEIFEPDGEVNDSPVGPNPDSISDMGEHLYVRIPNRMKERLDDEHQTSGRSYGEQVRQALRVLTQLTREMESCIEDLAIQPTSKMKGEVDARILKLAAIC